MGDTKNLSPAKKFFLAHVTKHFEFSAAHAISTHPGKCKFLHGHNFEIIVTAHGIFHPQDEIPMVVEFKELKKYVTDIIDPWDHGVLLHKFYEAELAGLSSLELFNNVFYFDFEPTAECLALHIKTKLMEAIKADGKSNQWEISRVEVRETSRSSVSV